MARLTHNLTHLHYEDEIRTHELIEDLAGQHLLRVLPTSSRYKDISTIDENPRAKVRPPIAYYARDRFIKGEEKLYCDAYFQPADVDPGVMDYRGNRGGLVTNFQDFDAFEYKYDQIMSGNWDYGAQDVGRSKMSGLSDGLDLLAHKNEERLEMFGKVLKDRGRPGFRREDDILTDYISKDLLDPIIV